MSISIGRAGRVVIRRLAEYRSAAALVAPEPTGAKKCRHTRPSMTRIGVRMLVLSVSRRSVPRRIHRSEGQSNSCRRSQGSRSTGCAPWW